MHRHIFCTKQGYDSAVCECGQILMTMKSTTVTLRCTEEEKEQITRAAREDNRSISNFLLTMFKQKEEEA